MHIKFHSGCCCFGQNFRVRLELYGEMQELKLGVNSAVTDPTVSGRFMRALAGPSI